MSDTKNTPEEKNPLEEAMNFLAQIVEENKARIEALEARIGKTLKEEEKPKKLPLPDKSVIIDKKRYVFRVPKFYHAGQKLFAAEVIEDKALCEEVFKESPSLFAEAS